MKVISYSLLSCIGCLCLLRLGCGSRDKGTSQAGSLPSLPLSLSEYCGHIDWQQSETKKEGLPEDVRIIQYMGEAMLGSLWARVRYRQELERLSVKTLAFSYI